MESLARCIRRLVAATWLACGLALLATQAGAAVRTPNSPHGVGDPARGNGQCATGSRDRGRRPPADAWGIALEDPCRSQGRGLAWPWPALPGARRLKAIVEPSTNLPAPGGIVPSRAP